MTDKTSTDKPWGGRFTESTDAFVEAFTASVNFDQRLYRYDIEGSRAHARMLAKVGVITAAECVPARPDQSCAWRNPAITVGATDSGRT
jgi:argininosuccinate lyase